MFRSFLKDEMRRKKLSQKSAAQQIGITPLLLKDALKNKPVDEQTVEAICEWLDVPSSPLVTSAQEKVFDDYEKYMSSEPNLVTAVKFAAHLIKEGDINEDEFREVMEEAFIRAKQSS